MTGGSLGLRTGSYGSLQQQQMPNVGLQAQNFIVVRKPPRMSLSGSREKERFLPFIFRHLARRNIAMLILVITAFAFCMTGFFTVNREESSLITSVERFAFNVTSEFLREESSSIDDNPFTLDRLTVCGGNTGLPPALRSSVATAVTGSVTFPDHPCEHFAFPPPRGERKRIGPRPCPVCYLPVEQAIASMPSSPSASPVIHHLSYFREESPVKTEPHGGSDFGGYPSLKQRNDSFTIRESMTVHCGFVKGCRPGHQTGFDIDVADLRELEQFHDVIVASAIFGNYDIIQQPKDISKTAKENIPFYMFIDEETEAYMTNSSVLDNNKRVGLWRIVIVRNIPYTDARRNGKVPKLLLHRLFPNVRYSIWIDGKLQLVVDPYQILERFLWRQNATFAISRHYRRFDVFEEAEANKAAGKYDNTSIDFSDQPRFSYRGLLIDTSRHYQPLPMIKKVIDSMAYAKLNVLHWHIVDEQSFPLEIPSYPKLWDGAYSFAERYTMADASEIVSYAQRRGINVLSELDVPGHALSWGVGYPSLWPSQTCKEPLDVSNEFTFKLIDGILSDFSKIFRYKFIHLGGDEVDTSCWGKTPRVRNWLKKHGMNESEAYQYFVLRAQKIAVSHGYEVVNWEETFNSFGSKLSPKTIVHNWLGGGVAERVVAAGLRCIVSNQGMWYLDHLDTPWQEVYKYEPLTNITNPTEQKLVIGGEVCMWGEHIDGSDIEQTIWPRAAAAAERLWTPYDQLPEDLTQVTPRLAHFRCLLNQRGVAAAPLDGPGRIAPQEPGSCYMQ